MHRLLVKPTVEYLQSYRSALERGWSPDNVNGRKTALAQLEKIGANSGEFLASLDDRGAEGGPITLPDGTQFARLPGFVRWIWDGDFKGSIGFRWQRGTAALPPHVLGHIGYAVVPWAEGRGYATRALAEMLNIARAEGLPHVEITTTPDNVSSQRVIEKNGGVLVEEFEKLAAYGGGRALRYRVRLID
jgi:predicted acetyltransferase